MNILFVTADQWRGECLSALGHPVVRTPNLDALAKEGTLFRRHYAQACPCAPSRTSIHTGMYMQNHRCVVNGTPVDSRLSNWALEVRKAGFDPSLFGYTDTAVDPRELSDDDPRLTHYSEPLPGIGSYTAHKAEVSVDWIQSLEARGYTMPEYHYDIYGETIDGIEWEDGGETPLALAINAKDHEPHYMVDQCIDWIKQQDQPWITHLSLFRPHPPFVAPEPYNRLYDPATMESPNRCADPDREAHQHPFLGFYLKHTKYAAHESGPRIKRARASYYGLMTEVDDNLGRLITALKASGQWESTLIIFTSDHGEQLGDHWLKNKLGYFDQSYHIPLIIRDPRPSSDLNRAKQLDVFSENVDLMPTMLDWLGLEIPAQCDGRSLIPILQSGKVPSCWRKEVHWEYDFRNLRDDGVEKYLGITAHQCNLSVIRDDRYKYVHFTALPPLFFDLQEDPGEFVNQADNPEYQSRVLEYAQKMLSWRMNHADRGLTETLLSSSGPVTRRSTLSPRAF